jgi:hypothetical protein
MDVCRADLRCLDAHAHLGNLAFGPMPWKAVVAVRHYEVGFRIGELSLPRTLMVSWRGDTSTIGHSCGACMDTVFACGYWADLKKPRESLTACFG